MHTGEASSALHLATLTLQVQHYGYAFNYDTKNVDVHTPLKEPFPEFLQSLLVRLSPLLQAEVDQITVNEVHRCIPVLTCSVLARTRHCTTRGYSQRI